MLAEQRREDAILPADFFALLPMSRHPDAPRPDEPTKGDDGSAAAPGPVSEPVEGLSVHPLVVRLVEWRRAKGWTQERTAEHLSIPLNTLRGYECGNRNPGGGNTEKILALVGLPKSRKR